MRWVHGLNRLRHLRLELDPGLRPYLVTSAHDDLDSVLLAYAPEDASNAHALFTLAALMIFLNAVLAAVVVALVAVQLDMAGVVVVAAGTVVAVLFVVVLGVWTYRQASAVGARFRAVAPAPAAGSAGSPASTEPPVAS
jgi:hypothetical protein